MALRKAIVVATYPKDHAVDLIMVDNWARFVGVQVSTASGSARTGSNKIPRVRDRGADKWAITRQTPQEVMALVDFVGKVPIVTGFIFPQISQMTFEEEGLDFERSDSDVIRYTDAEGNVGLLHPSGAYVTMGTKPDRRDFTGGNFDKNLAIDRNTGTKPYYRIGMAGNVVELTFTPEGKVLLLADDNIEVTSKKDVFVTCVEATVKASDGILLDTPTVHATGKLHVDGEITTNATVKSTGDQIAGSISQIGHKHGGVRRDNDVSDGPQ